MGVKIIPEGTRFGRLTVTRKWRLRPNKASGKNNAWFTCTCDCGNSHEVMGGWLKTGNTTSCGCYHQERQRQWKRKYDTPTKELVEYQILCGIYSRCYNPNDTGYAYYGGRGISVSDRWRGPEGYSNFIADMGPRPGPKYSIDRIDNDGNYEASNCRWATPAQQAVNKRPRKKGQKRGLYKKETKKRRPKGYRNLPDYQP